MSNPIGWCDTTVNVISGCLNNCEYCYARKFAHRLAGRYGYPADEPFKPTFHPDKLQDSYNLPKAHKRVFLDSMGDWFSDGVDPAWISDAVEAAATRPEHTFLVLTKRPDKMMVLRDLDLPKNLWFGVSVTCQDDLWRVRYLIRDAPIVGQKLFVSIEPLHGFIDDDFSGVDWLIIGAESGNRRGKIKPELEWVDHIFYSNEQIPIFMKDNMKPYLPDRNLLQEFPEGA